MIKINPKKFALFYLIILAFLFLIQIAYVGYVKVSENSNHKKVESILDKRLKYSWDEKDQILEEINNLLVNEHLSDEDKGRLYERAGIIYFNQGETTTYFKNLGYTLYFLENSEEYDFSINVYLDLANFYLNNYDYDSAEAVIAKAQELRPFDEIENVQIKSYAYRIMGITSFLRYHFNDAETYLNQSIRFLDEGDTEAYKEEYTAMSEVWLARIYEETGRLSKCKEVLDRWKDSYMFSTEIYRSIYLRDFIIPYYQAKCYYLCAENIKEYSKTITMDTDATEQAVIEFLREFMRLCEDNNYERAELYTLLKVQKEYPTRNAAIQSELNYILNRLHETIFKQQNLTYSKVVGSIVDEATNELAHGEDVHRKQLKRLELGIAFSIIFSCIFIIIALLLYNSRFDGLTKLLNRKTFDYELYKIKRSKNNYGIIMIDIDNFKRVNDTYGHPNGDIVLWRLGQLIRKETTSEIKAFRYGGEEFVLLCEKKAALYVNSIAERLRKAMPEQQWAFDTDLILSISSGTSTGSGDDDVVKKADDNLYVAKTHGKNQVVSDYNNTPR